MISLVVGIYVIALLVLMGAFYWFGAGSDGEGLAADRIRDRDIKI